MWKTTLTVLLVAILADLTEGVCNGYYYSTCSTYVYQKQRYTVDCGWWSRCSAYRQTGGVEYYSCVQRCPAVNGGWSDWANWGSWSSCSKTCESGSQTRTRYRSCTNPSPQNDGYSCAGSSSDSSTQLCNTLNCPINGGWSAWANWGSWNTCSKSCDSGSQARTRYRSCSSPSPQYGGSSCSGSDNENSAQLCNTLNCPVNGGWSAWANWGSWNTCSKSCDSGSQTRTRYRSCSSPSPQYGGSICAGSDNENSAQLCNTLSCPVNGGWSDWANWESWTSCSKTCESGSQSRIRNRSCTNPSPQNNGSSCPGLSSDSSTQLCNIFNCPIDGGWSAWADWDSWTICSKSCGSGSQTKARYRSCNSPAPQFGGSTCFGSGTETSSQLCNTLNCPIDGGWTEYTEWTYWTTCSETCGEGVQRSTRSRTCENPKPQFDGKSCLGDAIDEQTKPCKLKNCPVYCECSTVGDTHYKKFGGQWIHFMGSCQFQMAASVDETKCPFSVVVINKAASLNEQLPYNRSIKFTINNMAISLLQNKRVLVNSIKVSLPYSTTDKSIEIFMSGRYVRVQTECGVIVEWDGVKNMELAVQDTFANTMTGLCGDCTGARNASVTTNTVKYSSLAESFALKDSAAANGQTCSEITEIPVISDEIATIATSDEYCGYLMVKENGTSPFKTCLGTQGMQSNEQYTMCVMDLSLYYNTNDIELEQAMCNNLEGFAMRCDEKSLNVKWRTADLCPIRCGENEMYSTAVSGCQANCVNRNSETSCELPPTEGCACKEGFILSGHKCVKIEDCGCNSKIGYIALGEEVMSNDCSMLYKCLRFNDTIKLTEEPSMKCNENAVCGVNDNGDNICKCKKDYVGDGINECKPKEKDCLKTKQGTDYKGQVSKTVSGISCQEWAKTEPHKHKFTSMVSDGNYCRNPDGADKPWCYTVDKTKRWEYCNVPSCEVKECKTDEKGTDYNGYKSTTSSGVVCQAWSSSSPHTHRYGGLASEKNYCRNPDGSPKPWCYTEDPKKRWEYCDIPMCEIKECMSDSKGTYYNGHKNTTVSGLTCQAWGSNVPHQHKFGNLAGDVNYCRNPDGSGKPWCYTTDPKKRWEYCDIPLCCSVMETSIQKDSVETKRSWYLNWEQYFMAMSFISGQRSKDPVTQVGACIVNSDKRIVGMGYNGMPNNCSDDAFPWGKGETTDTNKKLYADIRGCEIYVTRFPCNECAKLIVQSGLKKVTYYSDKGFIEPVEKASKRMLEANNVELKKYEPSGVCLKIGPEEFKL